MEEEVKEEEEEEDVDAQTNKDVEKQHENYQRSTKTFDNLDIEDQGEQNDEQNIAEEPAPKRACYSPIKSTKELTTAQQEKSRKYNKMTTSKSNTVSFQVNNFVKIKINKVDKIPLHPKL